MQNFCFLGKFYKNDVVSCREVLFIKKTETNDDVDLLVIMMNPGSSHPKDSANYHYINSELMNKLVPTQPDNTQNKIIEYMEKNKLNHACILNLTNICNQKSNELKAEDRKFSNFDSPESAINFINKHSPYAKHILIAWGCKTIFKPLIENCKSALTCLNGVKIYGFNKISDTENLYYYHPLSRNGKWIDKIKEIIWH